MCGCVCGWVGGWVWRLSEVVVAPPFVYIPLLHDILRKDFAVAAQNCWVNKGGAYTGETR